MENIKAGVGAESVGSETNDLTNVVAHLQKLQSSSLFTIEEDGDARTSGSRGVAVTWNIWKSIKAAVRQFLSEHLEDDVIEVDAAWLRKSGFIVAESFGGDAGVFIIGIGPEDGDDSLVYNLNTMRSEIWIGSRYVSLPGRTRGSVRRLASALRVPLCSRS